MHYVSQFFRENWKVRGNKQHYDAVCPRFAKIAKIKLKYLFMQTHV